jgi:hypothetical protein
MITLDQSRALGAHLAAGHGGASIYTHDSPGVALLLAGLRYVTRLAPIVGAVAPDLSRVSVTLPLPGVGTVIVLSPAAVATPEAYAETVAHEVTHAHQAAAVGAMQSDVDYLGSGELRATREAQAYVVGLWVRYLLTGSLSSVEDAMASLASGLYHLAPEEVALARGIVTSGVETMRGGACPAYAVAVDAWAWLSKHAPEAIVVETLR